MGLLSALGINLPGPLGGNPFSALTGQGGLPVPPTQVGQGLHALVPELMKAFTGQLGQQPAVAGQPSVDPAQTPQPTQPTAAVKPPAMFVAPPKTLPTPALDANWAPIRAGIFKGESGGDYNTLYGHAEKSGPFAGTKVSNMTVDQAIQFGSRQGPYGQWASQKGISAAPMGAYQIINSTLKNVKAGMGLTGSEIMTPALQEQMGKYIYHQQGTGAWAGYHGPADPNSVPGVMAQTPSPTFDAMSRPSGLGVSQPAGVPTVGGAGPTGLPVGDATQGNTALADASAQSHRRGGGGGSGGPSDPGASPGRTVHNNLNPDYKRYQVRKNTDHLRALSPVATIQTLANIGKGLSVNGGGSTS